MRIIRLFIVALILYPLLFSTLAIMSYGQDNDKVNDSLTTFDPNLYLFVDNYWIAESMGIVRIMNHPKILPEPIISPDNPRTQRECAWGNVIREPDGRFRLWYATMNMGHLAKGPHDMAMAGVWGRGDDFTFHPRSEYDVRDTETMLGRYAESIDGINWKKPELGLVEYNGNTNNNIIITGNESARQTDGALTNFDGYTIIRDDNEPNQLKRYKMVAHWESVHFWDNHEVSGSLERPAEKMQKYKDARGKYITYSPDGLIWIEPLKRIAFPDGGGDRFLVIRDHRHGRFWGYSRIAGYKYAGLSTSADLETWSKPSIERNLVSDPEKYPAIECLIPFNYGNQDLGFVVSMEKEKGIMLAFLVSHHDGEPWKWIDRDNPFIPAGTPGSYNATGAVPLHNEPIIVGNRLFLYFNAFAYNQQPPCPFGSRTIGVAIFRRDGFVGLTSESGEAMLLTRPVIVTADNLYLNVEQQKSDGSVEVMLLTPDRKPIQGFGFEDAVLIEEDSVRHPVTWKNRANVKSLLGRNVMVQIRIRNGAVLYALAFGK